MVEHQYQKTKHTQTDNKGVSLASKDLNGVYSELLVVDSVDFDDSHVVSIDGEREVRVAGDTDKAETVPKQALCELLLASYYDDMNSLPFALFNVNNGKIGCGTIHIATKSIDQSRVWGSVMQRLSKEHDRNTPSKHLRRTGNVSGRDMIPIG